MDGVPATHEELIDLTRRQARLIETLRAEVERLKKDLEESRRAGKRQAAPFSNLSARAFHDPSPQVGCPPFVEVTREEISR